MRIINLLWVLLFTTLWYFGYLHKPYANQEQPCQPLASAMLKASHAGFSFFSTSINFEGLTLVTYVVPTTREWLILSIKPLTREACHYDHGTDFYLTI